MKDKFTSALKVNADDACSGKLIDIQRRLDELQHDGMSATDIRTVLFNKMLDVYQVPNDHFLREGKTPARIDDPSIVTKLKELGFSKKSRHQLH
ncbi:MULTISPECIES: hypothetical protein [unclassified Pseudoalteromonas]|uniref:hypothetical protein n=1 Tax=unclassified Pseudoalteromonas TaxID=194690 RepID=UPI0010230223|nr:hypothetical protein [Pseudoalteromonas sp. L1]RZF92066.1 hypothetical protein EXT42_12490 [Pseudoalteromonas sp. CO302Y]RZG08103.1 hypothetical protein EXT40_13280 [Pseudoalteromonas sp. CO133X]